MSFLNRLWTGIVSAVSAVAVALIVQLILGVPIEFLQWLVLGFGAIGFLVGVIVGNRNLSAAKAATDKTDEGDIWIE